MNKFDIRLKRLALLLLPTFLRQPLMASLTYAVVAPLCAVHARLLQLRNASSGRLLRNGQVCHLRAVLNDRFDPQLRRITVTDTTQGTDLLLVCLRDENRAISIPRRETGRSTRLDCRRFGGAGNYDFAVNLPAELRNVDETRIAAVVDAYKLVSKRFAISYNR